MSAIHTRQKTDRMKLMPCTRACTMASQAPHSSRAPSASRSAGVICGQPAGPTRSAKAPPSTHTPVASHQAQAGGAFKPPISRVQTQASASDVPAASAPMPGRPFSLAHSQPAAPIISTVSPAKGQGEAANSAGSNRANSTTAVITRVLSIAKVPSGRDRGVLDAAEAAVPLVEGRNSGIEFTLTELGPQTVREHELGVGGLPEQEVADAHLAAGADEQVRVGRVAQRHELRQPGLGQLGGRHAGGDGLAAGLHDVPPPPVVEGDVQRQLVVVQSAALGLVPGIAQLVGHRIAVADDADAHAHRAHLGEVAADSSQHQAHQPGDLVARPLPVLAGEGEDGEVFDVAVDAGLHHLDQRIHPGLVAEEARQEALLGPTAIAIHHDGDMARRRRAVLRHGGGRVQDGAQTAMISASLAEMSLSISAITRSVSFCTSSRLRRSSSSPISLSLSSFLACSLASRRRLRTATLASSPALRTTLVRSLRRSSVSGGIGTRIRSPWADGFRPRSLSRMAFSILAPMPFSQGWTEMVRASSSVTLAT
mmetsp:Transcript_10610/g.43394  ORF Transcript_10610/g.43394 Transcript_10610/m.43394 type:complete len:538 (+) Transcript_10610:732-2345(+)